MPAHKPVTIKGVTYPSAVAASKALGISAARIRRARRTGRYEWLFIEDGRGVKKPITIDGVTYPTRAAAARAIGVHVNKLREHKRRPKKT